VPFEDSRRAIESIKLRVPIEEVVRERVPGLKKAGSLWVACCPFHDEKSPSFKVDPRRGTWHCFGACSTGGDQFTFLERMDNLPFREVLEILAARAGVELPARRGAADARREKDADEPVLGALELAARFYASQRSTAEGRSATEYMRRRGLTQVTVDTFGVGYSPASGNALVQHARAQGIAIDVLEAAGLARTNERGPYDFFRGRLMIPIRDLPLRDQPGRVLGFGARRLSDDDPESPKYVNTPETRVFHKGRVVYALDRALPVVRRTGHIVLMEGYTDVMAAHQVGLAQCVAVLGTATTEDHAALIKRSGARRVTLLFDGDEAGRKAAWKALSGLVHLDVKIDVVALTGGDDPCDVLVREGSAPLVAGFELATDWFTFAMRGLTELRGVELSRAVDPLLDLIVRLDRPVQRESLVKELSREIGISVEALREQYRLMRGGARERRVEPKARVALAGEPAATVPAADSQLVRAFEELVGALILDASLVPLVRPERDACPDAELGRIFDAVLELYADENAVPDETSVLNLLADDPARTRVVPLAESARLAETPRAQLDGALVRLKRVRLQRRGDELAARLREAELAAAQGDPARAGGDALATDAALVSNKLALELSRSAAEHDVERRERAVS
jgi:DNA primase